MGALGEIFAPIIPALICGSLILGFRNIIGELPIFNGQTLASTSQFWEGTYNFLWLIGEAVFHLLPVDIVLGLTLVSPQLLNGFSVASTPASQIPVWDFGFAQVQMIGYQGQVIAAMIAGFVLVFLEKFFRKHCLAVISMIVVPFCSLVPDVIIAHTLVGPIGWAIGNFMADDCFKQYCARLQRIGNERSAEKKRTCATGQCACMYLMLSRCNRTGIVRREPEIRISFGMRNDRVLGRSHDFRRMRC